MSSIPSVSLTDLNRSTSMSAGRRWTGQPLALVTRYHKPAYAVLPLAVAHQLLQIAEQAARLRQQPDLLQLGEILLTIRQLPLLAEADWLSDCLDPLARRCRRISVTRARAPGVGARILGESAVHHVDSALVCGVSRAKYVTWGVGCAPFAVRHAARSLRERAPLAHGNT